MLQLQARPVCNAAQKLRRECAMELDAKGLPLPLDGFAIYWCFLRHDRSAQCWHGHEGPFLQCFQSDFACFAGQRRINAFQWGNALRCGAGRECWHEAGHAVVGHRLGMTIIAIGFSWPYGEDHEPNRSSWIPTDRLDKEAMATELFAGIATAGKKLGRAFSDDYYINQAHQILEQR